MTQRSYTIVKEPDGELYSKLLIYSLKVCKSFLLVIRPTILIKYSVNIVIDQLEPFLIEKNAQSVWPGTTLSNDTALVYHFTLNKKSVDYLILVTKSLYSWLLPDFPEDLCLLREDGEPWLVTISHERDAYLMLSDEEKDKLLLEIPELDLREDQSINN